VNYLFDTSAIVIHALRLRGAERVQSLMEQADTGLLASSLTLFELAGILKRHGLKAIIRDYWQIYTSGLDVISVDTSLAEAAWVLREETGTRIPIADAIIAATAQSLDAILVHRDQHLASIPESLLPQFRLPTE